MFKINILYDDNITNKYLQESVGIKCINCVKTTGCSLENQTIENFITTFF